jgi:hypothetical protein
MSSQPTSMITIFNDHFIEFISDICNIFPDNIKILTAKNALIAIRKANPKIMPYIWDKYISTPYKTKIDEGDISFFLEKDYAKEFENHGHVNNILEYINMIRDPIGEMGAENQKKTMKYIQNLCKISDLIPNN